VIESILSGLAATTPVEGVSVVLGLLYSILAVKRSRWCWVAGGLGSAILVYLSWVAKLPMQAALQVYYTGMGVYGFWRWSQVEGEATPAVSTLPLAKHVIAWAAILIVTAISSRYLAGQTQAAWPFLDSVSTWASLLAAWLEARVKVETWLYWIALDIIFVFLFYQQGLVFVATLFAVYLVISVFGLRSWLKASRQPALAT